MKSYSFSILIIFLLQSCVNHGQLNLIDKLPQKLKENSGIVSYSENSAWFIEDSGNSDNIYKTDFKGNIIQQFDIKNAKNEDWEDLTKDKQGNLYIGDFGNNDSKRKNLVIYKAVNPETQQGDKISVERIKFSYPEQTDFPPSKEQLFYDSEAFFHYKGYLYIFTKNRAKPFNGKTLVYRVPDEKGTYEAKLVGEILLCSDADSCKITSADISPDGKTIVLLSYGKLFTIKEFTVDSLHLGTLKEMDLGIRTQLESVCFTSDKTLLISDEERDDTGRNLYSYTLN